MSVENVVSPAAVPAGGLGAAASAGRRRLAPTALAVVALTLVGAVVRVLVARQSVFADELSTYWISATHSLGGVLELMYSTGRIHHAEITPPLSFLASWLSTRMGTSPELLRLPALLAGTATIPLVYLLGLRTVGRRAALLATALTALSPFMIYYSTEARAYGLLMFFVVGSTLSMLLALDTGRRRYWVLYAVCSAAAFYTHYTSLFVLGVQLVWLLWTEPTARRAALAATAGAVVLALPWIPGLIQDVRSPTLKILSSISLFTADAVRVDIEHWALGYPYAVAGGLRELPGVPALVLLAAAGLLVAAGIARSARAGGVSTLLARVAPVGRENAGRRRLVLLAALTLATPVGEIVGSATGNHIIGVRDLAASWPFLALLAAGFVAAAGRRTAVVAAALIALAFALAGSKMLYTRFARPDYRSAGAYVTKHARAGDVVVDGTGVLSPGPLTGFDLTYHGALPVIRAAAPAERDHPFTVADPITPIRAALSRAVRLAHGGRVFIVWQEVWASTGQPNPLAPAELPAGYRRRSQTLFSGFLPTFVTMYAGSRAGSR